MTEGRGDFTLVASGDAMITQPLSVFDEEPARMLWDTFRAADVGFANLETVVHEYEHPPGVAGGTFTASHPRNVEELKWAGINLVSTANNHSHDYGEGGLLTTIDHLRSAGIAYSGTGRNLGEARSPAYLETARGRVALIAVSSTFSEAGRALDQRPDVMGRPGLNPLRFKTEYTVDGPSFEDLRRTSAGLGLEQKKEEERSLKFGTLLTEDTDTEFHFLGEKFVHGDGFDVTTSPNGADLEGNLSWIRDARRMADWVLVSFHCHESGPSREDPPEFLVTFAHECIDQGADAFIGHGPHVTRGVEVYSGKPIFYSLGDFIFQNETVQRQPSHNYEVAERGHDATPADFYDARSERGTRGFPADAVYWESVVVRCDYRAGKAKTLTFLPIELGHTRPRSQRGRPVLASGDVARRILERIRDLSEPFGTTVAIEGDRGTVSIGP